MSDADEISKCVNTLRSSSAGVTAIRASLWTLERLATSGVDSDAAHAIVEAARCCPDKGTFGDVVLGAFQLDEAGASEYILRACASLELQSTALQSISTLPLPNPPTKTTIRKAIVEEMDVDAAVGRIDVVSLLLQCLSHMCTSSEHSSSPCPAWANADTTQLAEAILLTVSRLTPEALPRVDQAGRKHANIELMLQHTCIPCMKRLTSSLRGAPQQRANSDDIWHEGPDAFQRCTAAYQALQYTARLHHPVASDCVPPLLPVITTVLADPNPFAKRCAAAALSHLAKEATAAALYAHASVLKACLAKAFIGCEAAAWPALLHAACSLAARLDSVDGRCEFKMDVLVASVAEVQRFDSAEMWQPWLECLAGEGGTVQGSLLRGLGTDVLRCTSQLLPMLLQRLILVNAAEVQPICKALQVLQASAPQRMHIHAGVVLRGLRVVKQQLPAAARDACAVEVSNTVNETADLFEAER
eukprot:jgi/Ulvmu1/7063/UM033_0123.1